MLADTDLAEVRRVVEHHVDEIEKSRRLPDAVVDVMRRTGIFRLAMPRELGGLEVPITDTVTPSPWWRPPMAAPDGAPPSAPAATSSPATYRSTPLARSSPTRIRATPRCSLPAARW